MCLNYEQQGAACTYTFVCKQVSGKCQYSLLYNLSLYLRGFSDMRDPARPLTFSWIL